MNSLEVYIQGSSILAYLAVYLGGVLVSFTPCIYPVIPINVAYIGGQSGGSKLKGFVLDPCTAPVLAVLLGIVATRQNIVFGISLLFVFAFGIGTLLIILGSFSGILINLPKSGEWMVKIKKVFGWILIGIGEFFLISAGKLWV